MIIVCIHIVFESNMQLLLKDYSSQKRVEIKRYSYFNTYFGKNPSKVLDSLTSFWKFFDIFSHIKWVMTTQKMMSILFLSSYVFFFSSYWQRSNGASLICLHEQSDRNGDKYHHYVLYGLLAWTNDSANMDHTRSPHLFTNIFNYRYWLEKRLKSYIWMHLPPQALFMSSLRYWVFIIKDQM